MKHLIALAIIAFVLYGCTSTSTEEAAGIRLTKAPASPDYPEASLQLDRIDVLKTETNFDVEFAFLVDGYELAVQTADSEQRGIANSAKGQHIHLILNNGPYSAHYDPTFSKPLAEGNYVLLAFLSRSYHESVKNGQAAVVEVITIGEPESAMEVDLSAPHMFYSRPKGTYVGKDYEKLMIDFYLLNTTLSPDGNKVRVTVNESEFLIDEWAPYYVEGLEPGEVKIKLELIDANGQLIPGPFNVVERTTILKDETAS